MATEQIEQTKNGQADVRPDAIEVALDPLHVQKKGEIRAGALRNIQLQRETLTVEQEFGDHAMDGPIPGYPEVNGRITTFADRYREFDLGIRRIKEKSSVDVWEIAKRLYNDPAWEPQR